MEGVVTCSILTHRNVELVNEIVKTKLIVELCVESYIVEEITLKGK